MHFSLVYQAGLANVFKIGPGTQRTRVLQSDFRNCELFCKGAKAADAVISVFACNQAGDIAHRVWDTPLHEAPFCESFNWQF